MRFGDVLNRVGCNCEQTYFDERLTINQRRQEEVFFTFTSPDLWFCPERLAIEKEENFRLGLISSVI